MIKINTSRSLEYQRCDAMIIGGCEKRSKFFRYFSRILYRRMQDNYTLVLPKVQVEKSFEAKDKDEKEDSTKTRLLHIKN